MRLHYTAVWICLVGVALLPPVPWGWIAAVGLVLNVAIWLSYLDGNVRS